MIIQAMHIASTETDSKPKLNTKTKDRNNFLTYKKHNEVNKLPTRC